MNNVPSSDGALKIDFNVAAQAEEVQRSKPQLKLVVMYTSGTEFRLIGVYAKSKAPHSVKNVAEVLRTSIANLRKQ